ncbi:MAG: glycosyltransferase family 2 protein [Planctomycetaceae bacterium]
MTPEPSEQVDCSIVIPVYFNAGSLIPTFESIAADVFAANPSRTFEAVFVDDGSTDRSPEELQELLRRHPDTVRVVQLTRNFGQVNAIMAGLAVARGRASIVISADGQDPPALMNEMLAAHFDGNYEIAICERMGRDESPYRVATSRLFYAIMRRLCFVNMPPGGFDYVLLGPRARQALLASTEANPFFQGQILALGYRVKFLQYRRRDRLCGQSRWTFSKKLTYLIDGVAAYSFFPLRFMSLAGICIAGLGLCYALFVLVYWFVRGNPVQGWTPLMIVILVLGGVQMLMLGVIGEYVWRTLAQVRGRPKYIIERIYEGDRKRDD